MDVHFVGTEGGAALAQRREVEARRAALTAADVQHLALARGITADQQIGDLRQGRALDKAVDGMRVAAPSGTPPKMQSGGQIRRQTGRGRCRRSAARHTGEVYDASGHAVDPRAKQMRGDRPRM